MNAESMNDLAKVRYDRALELLKETEFLLKDKAYKSANNRAYYAAEKAIKAVLASIGKDAQTHNGVIRTFNLFFIKSPSAFFDHKDVEAVRGLEKIRSASDYDDFFLASKTECEEQVKMAKKLVDKVGIYLKTEGII